MNHIIEGKPPTPRANTTAATAANAGTASAQVRWLHVGAEEAGQRLDNYLMRHLKGVPKTHLYRIIRSGEVRINKGRCSADTRVQEGDTVRLPPVRVAQSSSPNTPDKATPGHHAPARQFPLLFEDEAILAIDKPAGVAVHGGSGLSFGVIEQLRRARPQAVFLELVHRLDRETSGILLVAKKRSALKHLQDQFRQRATGKTYLALVAGAWPAQQQRIHTPLHKYLLPNGERRVRTTTADNPDAMSAITLVQLRQQWPARHVQGLPAMSLLEVTIQTGRTHQIRVHLASQGHGIVGDDKYGDFALNKRLPKQGLSRMFLHAWRLDFVHPVTGEAMRLEAALPPELVSFLPAVEAQ